MSARRQVVLDASVILAFYLPAERFKVQALGLLEDYAAGRLDFVVPSLTRYELLSALSRAARGLRPGRAMQPEEVAAVLQAISDLRLDERPIAGLESRIVEICQAHQSSAYDASYLALAEHLDLALITGDRRFYRGVRDAFDRIRFLADEGDEDG